MWCDKRALVGELLMACSEKRKQMVQGVLADTMPPLHEWPEHHIRMLLAPKLPYNGIADSSGKMHSRHAFVCFVLGNGMPPQVLVDWIIAQPGYIRHFEGAKDIAELIRKHSKGELSHVPIWVMDPIADEDGVSRGQYGYCVTPAFAFADAYRAKMPVIDDSGAQKVVAGTPCWRVEYVPPGSEHWTKAADELYNYGKLLGNKKAVDHANLWAFGYRPVTFGGNAPQHFATGAAASHGRVGPQPWPKRPSEPVSWKFDSKKFAGLGSTGPVAPGVGRE